MKKTFLAILGIAVAMAAGFFAFEITTDSDHLEAIETRKLSSNSALGRDSGLENIGDPSAPADCRELAEPGYLEAIAERYPDYSYDDLCSRVAQLWPQAQAIVDADSQSRDDMSEYFIHVDRYSDYKSYDTETLEELAQTDDVAAQMLAHRQRYTDREASRAWFVKAVILSGKPGPLVDSLMYQKSIRYEEDPETGKRTYESVDDIVSSAVLATVAMRMGYPEDLRSGYMNHLAMSGMDNFESVVEIKSNELLNVIRDKDMH